MSGREDEQARLAVGVSGAGSNLRALYAAASRGELGGRIALVFADRACPALDWAAEQGIDTALVPGGDDGALAEALAGARPDVVVLAGYMRLIGRPSSPPTPIASSTPTRACCRPSPAVTPCGTHSRTGSP